MITNCSQNISSYKEEQNAVLQMIKYQRRKFFLFFHDDHKLSPEYIQVIKTFPEYK